MINFKEFVYVLGVVCKGDVTQKLKLLYMLHQLPGEDFDDMVSSTPVLSSPSKPGKGSIEYNLNKGNMLLLHGFSLRYF